MKNIKKAKILIFISLASVLNGCTALKKYNDSLENPKITFDTGTENMATCFISEIGTKFTSCYPDIIRKEMKSQKGVEVFVFKHDPDNFYRKMGWGDVVLINIVSNKSLKKGEKDTVNSYPKSKYVQGSNLKYQINLNDDQCVIEFDVNIQGENRNWEWKLTRTGFDAPQWKMESGVCKQTSVKWEHDRQYVKVVSPISK